MRIHIRKKDLHTRIHPQGSDSDSCFDRGNRSVHYPDYPNVCTRLSFRVRAKVLWSHTQLSIHESIDSSLRRWESREGPQEREQGSGVVRETAPRSSDGMAPPSDGGPSEAESQYRRIPPTPVCRDEVGLTSWLGKPLHLPALGGRPGCSG